ncbi:MAG TPA: NAD-binding protein [Anaerolineaceae bacterium]|jgi:trk system potassium uptake protein TrkA|nr:NAD-binding protein [Longilinea sp.]NMD32010.1 TrkA family potassium uptake protein [Chloroflexota bacterium]HNS63871.1 NAD-binding protein [Anaerolineaceae bacterium]HNZ00553.1 NAD-binding protein [Anaerolineaceae bacterium]HOD43695.1 NAD-binding protein [Anaerolineaceae bacterium]
MYVIIAGGGRTGAQLAKLLVDQDHDVHLIEDRKDVLAHIHKELPTESIHEGNPIDLEVLEQAGIQNAEVLAACTTRDDINLLLCYIAREKYRVGRTIARVNNPRDAWLFDEKFHVDVQLNQAEIMASMIQEEMSLGDMMTLLKLRRGNYSLVEEKIPAGALAVGRAIKDLQIPEGCVIAGIIRHGEMVVPRGQTIFEVGDEVLAITDQQSAIRLAELFKRPG